MAWYPLLTRPSSNSLGSESLLRHLHLRQQRRHRSLRSRATRARMQTLGLVSQCTVKTGYRSVRRHWAMLKHSSRHKRKADFRDLRAIPRSLRLR